MGGIDGHPFGLVIDLLLHGIELLLKTLGHALKKLCVDSGPGPFHVNKDRQEFHLQIIKKVLIPILLKPLVQDGYEPHGHIRIH